MRIDLDGKNYIDVEKVGKRGVRIRVCDGVMLIKPEASNQAHIQLLTWPEYDKAREEKDET